MGLPVVGRRYRRKTPTPQAADRGCGDIPERICRTCGSGCSSLDHQQSVQSQELATNHNQHGLGTLSPGGIACQSAVHPRLVHHVRKELDRPALGQGAIAASQDCRGRTLATGYPTSPTGPKPKSSASCRLCSRTRFVGNSATTIRSRPEYKSEAAGNEAQAPACGSVPSVRSLR